MTFQLKIALFILVNVGILSTTFGQNKHQCGTDHQELLTQRIQDNRAYFKAHPTAFQKMETTYIPIKFHLLAKSDGTGRLQTSEVLKQLCRLNTDYKPYDIVFYLKNDGTAEEPDYFSFLDNTGAYSDPRTTNAVQFYISNKHPNAVNVFIVNDAGTSGNITSAGFYTGFGDYIIVEKAQIGEEGNTTMTHELGHLFSLAHPHVGWEDNPWDRETYGDTVTITTIGSAQATALVEVVDRANCLTEGDFICDTPPDYYFAGNISGCNFTTNVWDRNFDLIEPIENNFMGYYFNCLDYHFSEDQIEAYLLDFQSTDRANLRSTYVPSIGDVVDMPTMISPAPAETTEYFNSVMFEWEAVPNASSYLLVISTGEGIQNFVTNETTMEVTTLPANDFMSWRLIPFNETSACAASEPVSFFTSDGNTAVNEINGVSELQIFPNPVTSHSSFKIKMNSNETLDGIISIYNLSGKKMYTHAEQIKAGKNAIEVQTDWAEPGIYFIKLETKNGIITHNFIMK